MTFHPIRIDRRTRKKCKPGMDDYPPETQTALKVAGWTPGRKVDVAELLQWLESSGFAVSPAAEKFLSEFVGLPFNVSGLGISCARAPFEINRYLAQSEDDRFE